MKKKSLPVVGKSLMPELLPAPSAEFPAHAKTPRERVRARLRQLSERSALLAVAAGLAAACDSGYGVVDPVPEPARCPLPDDSPLTVVRAHWQGSKVQLQLGPRLGAMVPPSGPYTSPPVYKLRNARAIGPVSVEIFADLLIAQLSSHDGTWPASIDVLLSVTCGGGSGSVDYELEVRLDTSNQRPEDIPFTIIGSAVDGGA